MIKFNCPHCGKDVTAADEHAGKKGRCPGCKEVFSIPAKSAAPKPMPAAERRTRPAPEDDDDIPMAVAHEEDEAIAEAPRKPRPAKPRGRGAEVDELEEVDDLEEVEDEDEEDDRPRRRKKRRRGPYADCPNCGSRGHATKVSFTWWGGIVGPAIISVVRCDRCGTAYNGKHGDYNTTRIAIYYGVGLAIGLALGVLGVLAK